MLQSAQGIVHRSTGIRHGLTEESHLLGCLFGLPACVPCLPLLETTAMASTSVLSSGLGMYRGYFVGKSSLLRQLTSASNDTPRRARKNTCCCYVSQRRRSLQETPRLPLPSLSPWGTVGMHDNRTSHLDVDSSSPSSLVCRASSSGSASLLVEEEIKDEDAYVEVGYIANTHGVRGELHVHSLTDFPEERFEKPGVCWLRTRSMGRPKLQQVELLKGRAGPGKRPSWLITLKNVNTPEKATELVGATMLVAEDKKPSLDADEFYIPDLVGMTVVHQVSGEEIGVILNVFKTGGANDLLQVRLLHSVDESDGRKIWIPFVKEIVPVVDNKLRRVEIVPPQGLLELNDRAKGRDAKDSKKQVIKERRKLNGKLGGLKKKLIAMGQTHVLAGLSTGTKEQQDALLEQLLSIDFGVLQQALEERVRPQTFAHPPEPPTAFPIVNWEQFDSWMDSPTSSRKEGDREEDNVDMKRWWRKGLQLVADGRVAVVVLAGGQSTRLGQSASPVKGMLDLGLPGGKTLFQMQAERLLLVQELASLVVDPEVNPFIPWLIMTSDATDAPTREYFEKESFFGLDESQVWFIKQDSMPCISLDGHPDILMETPWKIAQAPNGNGGLFSALHAEGTIDRLIEEGIDYVQVYAVDNALVRVADPVFFGYTKETEADVGVKVVTKVSPEEAVGVLCLEQEKAFEGEALQETSTSHYGVLEYSEMPEDLRYAREESELVNHGIVASTTVERPLQFRAAHICVNIFSVDFLRRLGLSGFVFNFHPALKQISHVKQKDKEWVEVVPEKPNGMKLELFIFDAFRFCDPDKVALLEVHRNEEFAPVKNAAGPGVPDTVDTARDLVLALQRRLSLSTSPEAESPQHILMRKLGLAYLGGYLDEDVLKLLDYPEDEQLS